MTEDIHKENGIRQEQGGGGTAPSNGTFRAFASRNYTRLWLANGQIYTCRWMQMTLLSWLILELTDSPWKVALVGFFYVCPTLLLGLAGGVLADEMDRRRLLIMSNAVSVVASLWLTVLLLTGEVQVWQAYLTAAINGASWAISFASRRALIFDLVGSSGVTNAMALDTVGMNISRMIGPGLSGVLITLTGVAGGYVVVTVSYALGIILLWILHIGVPFQREIKQRNVFRNLLEGFRYIRETPSIMAIVWITVVMNFFLFSYPLMVPVMARDVLHVGPTLMGFMQAAEGVGAMVGAYLLAASVRIKYHGRYFLYGSLLALTALCLFSLSRWYIFSCTILLGLGLGSSAFATMQSTIVMLEAKADMRGRALGVVSLAIGAGPLGALLLGAIADTVGPMFALRTNALLGILSVVFVAFMMPSLHKRTRPDHPV